MKTIKFLHTLAALAITAASLTACSSDDDNDNKNDQNGQNVPESQAVTAYDDLDYFQNAIVSIDSVGNFLSRNYGEILFRNDTTHLYIGVETLANAETIFREWVAPNGNVAKTGNDLTYLLTDAEGRTQGSILFKASTAAGTVAEVTPSSPTLLKHFSKVTFLQNSAWPYNGDSSDEVYKLGDTRRLTVDHRASGHTQDVYTFVCIREKGNGMKAMYFAISPDEYVPKTWTPSDLLYNVAAVPAESKAKTVATLLQARWDFFANVLNNIPGGGKLNRNEQYWIDKKKTYAVYTNQYAINLSNGEIEGWDFQWHNPKKHFILAIDYLNY